MNANELADWLEKNSNGEVTNLTFEGRESMKFVATMLRQQADRIALLDEALVEINKQMMHGTVPLYTTPQEKQSEPVAWSTKNPKTVQDFSFYQTQIYTEPLYTTPQTKPLSDEEIWDEVSDHLKSRIEPKHLKQFANSILRKAQEK